MNKINLTSNLKGKHFSLGMVIFRTVVTHGVPQGSLLGPLEFKWYMMLSAVISHQQNTTGHF